MKNIVVIGMPGGGKTTISKRIAKQLERPFIDVDEYIVETYQMTIPEMFAISEEYFRERETICCKKIAKNEGYIISTGGGIIKNPENIKALKETGIVIYLDRPVENILDDVEVANRPLLKSGPQALYDLYQQRHEKYLMYCYIHIINNYKIKKVTKQIIDKLNEHNSSNQY
ncbi:MAG: shikimate kinase [Coprobacillaceae bacterium]